MGETEAPVRICPLSDREQTRNVLIVGINTALCYLASPVLYVDAVHTALLNDLQVHHDRIPSATLSNMPTSGYMIGAAMPLLSAWLFPQVRQLRPTIVSCYLGMAIASALVVALLLSPLPFEAKAYLLVFHGFVIGMFRTVSVAGEFEVLGIAVEERRRGQALGIAYGYGPILAVLGNLLAQVLLRGGGWGVLAVPRISFPFNFTAVFAYTVPVLLLAAFQSSRLIIPLPEKEVERQPFVSGILGGIGKFLGRRVPLLAIISCLMVTSGYSVLNNMTLYAGELSGGSPTDTAGFQKAVLYTCKVAMGLTMGWVLTWAAPRLAVLLAACAGLSAIVFARFAPANIYIYMISFGLLGAGQLHGIYSTNYILSCASPKMMRKFMAFTMVSMLPTAFSGILYGEIFDHYGRGPAHEVSLRAGTTTAALADAPDTGPWPALATSFWSDVLSKPDRIFGYRMSFVAAALLVLVGIFLALLTPPRPKPEE